jgi:hypothetical protein
MGRSYCQGFVMSWAITRVYCACPLQLAPSIIFTYRGFEAGSLQYEQHLGLSEHTILIEYGIQCKLRDFTTISRPFIPGRQAPAALG